jgi:hypothetical protein
MGVLNNLYAILPLDALGSIAANLFIADFPAGTPPRQKHKKLFTNGATALLQFRRNRGLSSHFRVFAMKHPIPYLSTHSTTSAENLAVLAALQKQATF